MLMVLPVLFVELGNAPAPVRSNFSRHFACPLRHFPPVFVRIESIQIFSSMHSASHRIRKITTHCAFHHLFIPLISRSFARARAVKTRLLGVAPESARLFLFERAVHFSLWKTSCNVSSLNNVKKMGLRFVLFSCQKS